MRAWIEPDDDMIPILSIEKVIGGKIVEGRYMTWYPIKWHMEDIDQFLKENHPDA